MTMRALIAGDLLGGKWRIVRSALGDEPGSECQVEPLTEGAPGRLTLWRTLRAPTPDEHAHFVRLLDAGARGGLAACPPVQDSGYDPGREGLWVVRPWWNGESLPSMLGGLHEVGLDLPDLRGLAEQLGQALQGAHDAGLVHGRLRPSRVLVAPGPRGVQLSLLDLGLEHFRRERAADWLKPPQLGAAYLAPEWRDAGPLPASADVFAYGLIVRDLLATRRDGAWRGRWEPWVERATAPEPGARFGSVAQALAALRPVLQSLPEPPPSPPENYQPEPVITRVPGE